MTKLTEFGEKVDAEMKQSIGIYNQGVEEIKELNSNDLTALVEIKNPGADIVAVMDSVLLLLG